jgi:hypothetical protein
MSGKSVIQAGSGHCGTEYIRKINAGPRRTLSNVMGLATCNTLFPGLVRVTSSLPVGLIRNAFMVLFRKGL